MGSRRNRTNLGWNQLTQEKLDEIFERILVIANDLKRGSRLPKLFSFLVPVTKGQTWFASVFLVSENKIRQLNTRFRKKSAVTDVLSFPVPWLFQRRSEKEIFLGDLVICLPMLRKQAKRLGHPEERELEVLLVHGILHLLGFDHEKSHRDAQEMESWEKLLLGRKGLIERTQTLG